MATNDFHHASTWLDPDFEYYMPQSGEHLSGRTAFAEVNAAYPTDGTWTFAIRSVVADGSEAVSDVAVSDGTQHARAVTFHTVRNGLILRQIEYWPDPYPAPDWRKKWVRKVAEFPF